LGDHPFPAAAARLLIEGLAVSVAMNAVAQRVTVGHGTAQECLAQTKREVRGVVPGQMQKIEDVVEGGDPAALGGLTVSYLHAPLEAGEARPTVFEGDDLAVDDEVRVRLAAEGLSHFGVGVVQSFAVTRQQTDVAAPPVPEAA